MKLLLLAAALATAAPLPHPAAGPVKVSVRQQNGRWELLRGGQAYFIKGAGGSIYPERLAAYGGNSIRTWSTEGADKVLASARANGLTVLLGLDVARERHGFNYDDTAAVGGQLRRLRGEVIKYKNDPQLLYWGIGNELNLDYTNPRVWDAVNDIARMIHQLDPNHPTSTVLAGAAKKEIGYVKTRCPAVDILSINTYAGLAGLPKEVHEAGWTGPYVVAEWGPTGHWEGPQTPWKASVEETSSEKAAVYESRYRAGVLGDPAQCLGSYVFFWGQKQERTPTWYGLFTEDGQETEVMDVLQRLWTGRNPANRAPHVASFTLAGKKATEAVTLPPSQPAPVVAAVTDPDGDKLVYRYELLPESTDLKQGGDHESRPVAVAGAVPAGAGGRTTLAVPARPGAYRLFVYATDGHGNVATGNIPFLVH